MICEPKDVSDLGSGAMIDAEAGPGDACDTMGDGERVAEAIATQGEVAGEEDLTEPGKDVCADEGYLRIDHQR